MGVQTLVLIPKTDMTAMNAGSYKKKFLDIINRHSPQVLIINLSLVNYSDSAGIATLIATLKRMQTDKNPLKLYNIQPRVKAILDVTGLIRVFDTISQLPLNINPQDVLEVSA